MRELRAEDRGQWTAARRLLVFIFTAVVGMTAFAAARAETAPSAGAKISPEKKIELILNEKEFAEIEYNARPVVDGDVVNLIPGEKVFVQADIKKGKILSLRHVDVNDDPARTLVLEFKQNQDRKTPFMALSVKNPFDKSLKYEARIIAFGKDQAVKTPTLAVPSKMTNFESWPNPLSRVVLNNFKLVDEKKADASKPEAKGQKADKARPPEPKAKTLTAEQPKPPVQAVEEKPKAQVELSGILAQPAVAAAEKPKTNFRTKAVTSRRGLPVVPPSGEPEVKAETAGQTLPSVKTPEAKAEPDVEVLSPVHTTGKRLRTKAGTKIGSKAVTPVKEAPSVEEPEAKPPLQVAPAVSHAEELGSEAQLEEEIKAEGQQDSSEDEPETFSYSQSQSSPSRTLR